VRTCDERAERWVISDQHGGVAESVRGHRVEARPEDDPLDGAACLFGDLLCEGERGERALAQAGAVVFQVDEDLHG
jgi:hypothetical protein